MTTLFITSKSLGGSGKYISSLAKGIKSHTNCEILYYPSKVSQDAEIEKEFSFSHHFSKIPCFNPIKLLKNILQVRKILNNGNYVAVHTHTSLGGFIGRIGAFLSSHPIKIIHTIHAYGADEFTPVPQKWVYWVIERGLDLITDCYISPSQYMIEYGSKNHIITRSKANVIYNSLPLKTPGVERITQRKTVRETMGLLEDETLFLFCGRLEKQKGVDVLFDAIAKMDDRISFKVALCGEGDLRNELNEQANRLGIQHRLHWLGWQSEVSQFYAAADIYIMPSRWESFGLVFLEAMNYEMPILSTKTQAIPEVVENQVCGLLSDNEDSSQLANNMAILLNDKKLAIEMGMKGKNRLNSMFTFNTFIQSHMVIYEKMGIKIKR